MRTMREYRNERRFNVCYPLVDGRCRLASLGFASAMWNLSAGDQMSGWIACAVLDHTVNEYMQQGECRSRASLHVCSGPPHGSDASESAAAALLEVARAAKDR